MLLDKLIRYAFIFFIFYLIFTNFGTFLIIIAVIIAIFAYMIYNFKKKIKTSNFEFRFDNTNFGNSNGFNNSNFDFNDFRDFNYNQNGGFSQASSLGEVQKAKDFFGFTHSPTKEEIKKRYKELAKKYHPDINGGDDTKMKKLNNYRDILMQTVS